MCVSRIVSKVAYNQILGREGREDRKHGETADKGPKRSDGAKVYTHVVCPSTRSFVNIAYESEATKRSERFVAFLKHANFQVLRLVRTRDSAL